jgi:hypothetical protein
VFFGAFAKLSKATVSSCLSVCPSAWNNSAVIGRIFLNLYLNFFLNILEKFKFHYILTRITGTLHEDVCTVLNITRPFLLGRRNISDRFVEKIKTHSIFNNFYAKFVPFVR